MNTEGVILNIEDPLPITIGGKKGLSLHEDLKPLILTERAFSEICTSRESKGITIKILQKEILSANLNISLARAIIPTLDFNKGFLENSNILKGKVLDRMENFEEGNKINRNFLLTPMPAFRRFKKKLDFESKPLFKQQEKKNLEIANGIECKICLEKNQR